MDDKRRINAESFGQAAQAYERGRPPYPPAAVAWLVPENARQVLDLGAGTGKLTRQLCAAGLDVTAVEPSERMRDQLITVLPDVPALAGTAERIPLSDNSFDLCLVAQAWHWVEPALAIPEVARVLRPGGRLGLLWNARDESVGWVAELGDLLRASTDEPKGATVTGNDVNLGEPFGPVERFEVRWEHRMTPQMLLDMVISRSYVITAAIGLRESLLARIDDLLHRHPDLAGRDRFVMPYVTECFRADLRPRTA